MSAAAVLGALLSDTRGTVRRLLDEPLMQLPALESELDRYLERIAGAADDRSLTDWETGRELGQRVRELLDGWPSLDHEGRRLVQVAVRYLVLEDDGDGDLDSPFGFDDDREVVEAVQRALQDRRS